MPQWETRGRVRVAHRQLRQWYQTLDQLIAAKDAIETDLYLRLRDLFGLQVEMVFYDLTSTYFEGVGPDARSRGMAIPATAGRAIGKYWSAW